MFCLPVTFYFFWITYSVTIRSGRVNGAIQVTSNETEQDLLLMWDGGPRVQWGYENIRSAGSTETTKEEIMKRKWFIVYCSGHTSEADNRSCRQHVLTETNRSLCCLTYFLFLEVNLIVAPAAGSDRFLRCWFWTVCFETHHVKNLMSKVWRGKTPNMAFRTFRPPFDPPIDSWPNSCPNIVLNLKESRRSASSYLTSHRGE